jgi:transaldolase
VIDAYIRRLAARANDGQPLDTIASVASFFVSRIDTKIDAQLPEDSPLRGRVAIANARVAYQCYQTKFAGPEWERQHVEGAQTQRPLWASTGTKNPAYSDVLYVSELIAPDAINTMPDQTLRAFADHGEVARTLDADPVAARETLADAGRGGIDLGVVTAELERDGVQAFNSYSMHREQTRRAGSRRQQPARRVLTGSALRRRPGPRPSRSGDTA